MSVVAVDENDPIRKFQSEISELSEKAERLRPLTNSCRDAIDRSGVSASFMVSQSGPRRVCVEIVAMVKKLDEVTPLFRELAKEGYRTKKDESPVDENMLDFIPVRHYKMGQDLSVRAMVLGNHEQGESCRLEQVGVKEVPVYEMKCD